MKTGQNRDKVKKVKEQMDKGIMKTLLFMEKGKAENACEAGIIKKKCIRYLATGEIVRVSGPVAAKAVAANQAIYASKEEWKKGGRK